MKPEDKIKELGIEFPTIPVPTANYLHYRLAGDTLYISGQVPRGVDGVVWKGKLGRDITVEEGYQHARLSAINMLAMAKQALGDLDRVEMVVKLLGMVNSTPDFGEQPKVINGCSDLLVEVFGKERGSHARSAVGIASLPDNCSVEIEVIMKVKQ